MTVRELMESKEFDKFFMLLKTSRKMRESYAKRRVSILYKGLTFTVGQWRALSGWGEDGTYGIREVMDTDAQGKKVGDLYVEYIAPDEDGLIIIAKDTKY